MTFISLIIYLVCIGVFIYILNAVAPLPDWIKLTINALFGLMVFLLVIRFLGFIGPFPAIAPIHR